MPKYRIPVSYMMYGYYEIEAENIVEALDKALDPEGDFPENPEPLLDSLNVTEEDVVENNPDLSSDDRIDLSEYIAEVYRQAGD